MRLLTILVVLLAVLAGAAFATRPGPRQFDALLERAIREKVANTDVDGQGDAIATIALVGCKLRTSDCVKLVRESLDVSFDERAFYTRVHIEAPRRSFDCTGAFGRFFCRKALEGLTETAGR